MFAIIFSLFSSIRQGLRSRAALHAEILALRHQLLVLQRVNRDRRLRLSVTDRLLWVWLSRLWSGWRSALVILKPETVIAWHRRGFRLKQSGRSKVDAWLTKWTFRHLLLKRAYTKDDFKRMAQSSRFGKCEITSGLIAFQVRFANPACAVTNVA